MAIYPKAVRKLIAPGSNDPRINATQVILHVAVSEGTSLHRYFDGPSGGIESHFYIRRDGVVEQYRDTAFEADANYTANSRAISVETQGMGHGEWTPAQMAAIKELLLWANRAHRIPLRVCPRHDAPGIGYHVLFGAPGPWTPVSKSCPGPDRIKQFHNDLAPWMNHGAKTTTEDDDMALDEKLWPGRDDSPNVRDVLRSLDRFIDRSDARHKAMLTQGRNLAKQVAQIKTSVAALPEGATKQEVAELLEDLDAQIRLVINDTDA